MGLPSPHQPRLLHAPFELVEAVLAEEGFVREHHHRHAPVTGGALGDLVFLDDGAVVVLGGLLQDDFNGSQEKVPGLGVVPLFGNLFKSEARSRKKTNLMVFLRPVVVRDATATQALSNERYEQMRGTQQSGQPEPSSTLPINEAPVLPNLLLKPGNLPLAPAQ